MLETFLNGALNSVDKELGLIQALVKEGFKFSTSDGDVGFILHLLLVLLPANQSNIFERNDGKWHLILTFGPGGSKTVLTLLEEVIALQVSFTVIYI